MAIQDPIFFGALSNAGAGGGIAKREVSLGYKIFQPDTVAHLPVLDWPINIIPLCMAATQVWLMTMTPKTR